MATYAHTADRFRCDECSAEMAVPLFCDACGADYPERRGMSAFAILGLPATFAQDEAALDSFDVRLAQRLHPDRWQGRGERLHKKAQLAWSAVNEALGKVRDPFSRAATLLAMRGDEAGGRLPTDFLVEQLELQEEIEEGPSEERKRALKKQIRGELKALHGTLVEAFTRLDAGENGALEARDTLDRSRYWRNAERALRGQAPT